MNEQQVMAVVDAIWAKIITGLPGTETVRELGDSYLQVEGTLEEKINYFIRWQNVKAATTGFLTNLGGLITLPIAIPLDLAATLYVELRMIATVAYMTGNDPETEAVRSLCYLCLAGSSLVETAAQLGISASQRVLSKQVITQINKAVGMKLLARFGSSAFFRIGTLVPILGGFVGASVNAFCMNYAGRVAKKTFLPTLALTTDGQAKPPNNEQEMESPLITPEKTEALTTCTTESTTKPDQEDAKPPVESSDKEADTKPPLESSDKEADAKLPLEIPDKEADTKPPVEIPDKVADSKEEQVSVSS